jgi:hypothetical protein
VKREVCVQSAKDTFYEVLRGRVAVGNPDRTVVLRGVVRPGVLVEENELVMAVPLPDCFRLRWGAVKVDARGAMSMIAMQCEIAYETAGTAMNAGMDRGRMLGAMDAELLAAVNAAPQSGLKNNYAGLAFGQPVVAMATNVWWGDVVFEPVKVEDDRLVRTAVVEVMSYQKAGEL